MLSQSSPIRTLPSALDFHQVSRCQNSWHASRGLRHVYVITAGRDFHPALKIISCSIETAVFFPPFAKNKNALLVDSGHKK
jgi:hypothetical protein